MGFLLLPFQTLLRELEFKKPQLDELVNTAESLKSDANKLQLQTKGEFYTLNTSCYSSSCSSLTLLGASSPYLADCGCAVT